MDMLAAPSRLPIPVTPTLSIRSGFIPHRPSDHGGEHRHHGHDYQNSASRRSSATLRLSLPSPALINQLGNMDDSIILDDDECDVDSLSEPPWYQPERKLLAIKFVYFFVYANTACLIPYFVTYYYEWGLTPTEQSIIQAIVPFFGFLIRPVIGRLADLTNHHRLVFAICCLWCGLFHIPHMFIPKLEMPNNKILKNSCNSNCSISDEVVYFNETISLSNVTTSSTQATPDQEKPDRMVVLLLLLGLRLVAYAGQAPTQDLADAFGYSATNRCPRRWGRQRVWSTVGWASATLSVGYVLNKAGHYWLFLITAVFNTLAAVSIAFLEPLNAKIPTSAHSGYRTPHSVLTTRRVSVEPQVTLMTLLKQTHVQVYLLFSMLSGSLLAIEFSFLLIFIKDSGGDELLIGLHQVVDSLSEFPLFLFSGYIITWLGFVPCFCLSFCTYIIRLISYSFLSDPLYLVLLVETCHCFSFTLYVAAGTAYADSITVPGLAATLHSMFQGVFFGLGIGAGNLVGGFLYPVIGPRWLFRCGAVLAALCALSYFIVYYCGLLRPKLPKEEEVIADDKSETVTAVQVPENERLTIVQIVTKQDQGGQSEVSLEDEKEEDDVLVAEVKSRRSNSLMAPNMTPPTELFLSSAGLHRSPGINRTSIPIKMTPLTRRIIQSDGFIEFIDG